MLKMYRPPIQLQLRLSGDEDTKMFSADFTTRDLNDKITETAMEGAYKFFDGEKIISC